jgi:hypothetical protein
MPSPLIAAMFSCFVMRVRHSFVMISFSAGRVKPFRKLMPEHEPSALVAFLNPLPDCLGCMRRDHPSLKLAGLDYKDLVANHPQIAEEFDNYNLDVMSVAAQRVDPINELFVRLNRSKALTGAEIRNAMSGPAPEVIRQIAKHEVFKTNVSFAVKRGEDLNAAAKLLIFEYNGKPVETKKTNLDAFVKQVEKKDERGKKLELSARRGVDVLTDMSGIFLPHDKLLGSSGIFPVYYWFIRGINSVQYHKVRSFLLKFERERAENRRIIAEEPNSTKIDRELDQYDKYNRSTNDQTSHVERIKILQRRFRNNY